MTGQPTPEQAYEEFKRACLRAYGEIQRKFSSGQVARATGLSESVVRKLGADGDKAPWRRPSMQTCKRIDEFCRTRQLPDYQLARLRAQLDRSGWQPARDNVEEYRAVASYLTQLQQVMLAAPRWMPFSDIGQGFQERMLYVTHIPPTAEPDHEIRDVRIPRGDVPWANVLTGAKIAAVISDAGFGKTWQTRRYAAQLAADALAEDRIDGGSPVPLWLHAGDLGAAWPGTDPVELLVEVATVVLRRQGIDTRAMQDDLTTLIKDNQTPITVLVDAYDEVVGDGMRAAARGAVAWLARYVRNRTGYQLLLTSRAAGYDQPFDESNEGDEGDEDSLYLYLGGLEEAQVRRLWHGWFERRGEPVPLDRLEGVLAPDSALRQFVRVPLIAAFCAWVAEVETVAKTRAQLFDQVVQRFLARAWKKSDLAYRTELIHTDDGARRAGMAVALARLAWVMGCLDRWSDTIDVLDCEAVLTQHGPAPMPGSSLTFEAVRGIGILVQPAVLGGGTLGDGPVSWIHRSVQEFLAARHLLTLQPSAIREVIDRAWFSAPLTGVLDFALGLADDRAGAGHPVRLGIDELITTTDTDPLGYYTLVIAGSEACTADDAGRLWRLHGAGLITTESAASALARSGYADDQEKLVQLLLAARADTGGQIFDALAWCGPAGRAALAHIIATKQDAAGASAALYRVDSDTAVTAVETRIRAGLPLTRADAACLREVGPELVELLVAKAQARPESAAAAVALGLTRQPIAPRVFREHLAQPNARVRHAAAQGLSVWYGNALDPDGFALLAQLALHDEDQSIRLAVRGALVAVGLSLPWVARAMDDIFEPLHDSDDLQPMVDRSSLTERLWPLGPATHKVVVMLGLEPRLYDPSMDEPLTKLRQLGLAGGLDFTLTKDLAMLPGGNFIDAAIAVLRHDSLTGTELDNLAVGLAMAVPDDPQLFNLLLHTAGRRSSLLLEAVLANYSLPADQRVRSITDVMLGLGSRDYVAVQVWTQLLRRLLYTMPFAQRQAVRSNCAAATSHVLRLTQP